PWNGINPVARPTEEATHAPKEADVKQRALALVIVVGLVAAACGDSAASSGESGSTTTPSTTEAGEMDEVGTAEAFIAEVFATEGFTDEEASCLAGALADEYGDAALGDALFAEEDPPGFDAVIETATFECISAERLIEIGGDDLAGEAMTETSSDATATSADDPSGETWAPKTIEELVDPTVIVNDGFGWELPAGWFEQVWFKPAESGELWWEDGGSMHFTGGDSNSRAGVRLDLNLDVSDVSHAVVAIHGIVNDQTLAGTGFDGREAPLAMAVAYVDEAGTSHVGLSEDPTSPTNVFYRGFSILEPDDRTSMTNGLMVTAGEPFIHQFDLMSLDPPPVEILFLIAEGGGWPTRDAVLAEMALVLGD
ncbi:MAG: hypothetical protein KJO84_05620, partial [Acidimicrobiia bacterium]|nr:hypothetical protein [Acidimicrobiia bacterium]